MRAFFRFVVSAALIGASLGGAPAMAADAAFPTHPLTLVNPYAAGGPADVLARALARALEERLKQPVIVENKAGGAATIGTGFVARAKPDGYTLLMGTSAGHVVTPLMQTTPYDGVADFSFIGIVANQPNVLVVNATLGVESLEGLVALAGKASGTLNYASAGTGGATHLGAEAFLQKAGLRITHIPYPGASPALKDLLGGQVQLGMLNLAATLPFIEQGKLRALAYGGPKRAAALPQVPTLAEAGYGGTEVSTWYSLAAPKGTPPQAIEVLREAVSAIQATPAWQQFLDNQGAERMSLSPAQTTEFVRRDQAAMTTLLGALNLLAK